MSNRVAHFEIHADDLERAAEFYRSIFGWEITRWENPDFDYMMVMTGGKDEPGGINGGLVRRAKRLPEGPQGMNGYCCTVVVDDFDAYAEKILAAGGIEALPKMDLAGMAWQGYFLDTEGNTFGLHQEIKTA